ncbi:MAG TPA: DnaJ domain-containing protein [Pyrinomonadaceae bacterium]
MKCETTIQPLSQFDPKKNYYEVLGAELGASRRDIEVLYRRLAHRRHPDRGGSEDEMKALNEAYAVLHDDAMRKDYDDQRTRPIAAAPYINTAPPARDVGVYGQALNALACLAAGLMLLLLVRFNGLWFLWPLGILAMGVMLFGVLIAHSAVRNARESLRASHPVRRLRAVQELAFWTIVVGAVYGLYLILTAV